MRNNRVFFARVEYKSRPKKYKNMKPLTHSIDLVIFEGISNTALENRIRQKAEVKKEKDILGIKILKKVELGGNKKWELVTSPKKNIFE